MKKIINYTFLITVLFFISSCEDYLDKSIETDLSKEDIFTDFAHAQGFVENMYNFIVHYDHVANTLGYFVGDETMCVGSGRTMMGFDRGELDNWKAGYFVDNRTKNEPGIWGGWGAIRIANIVLENVDEMNGATETEKNLLKGQALFFRAFFHHEIMKFWGPIPYVDVVLARNDDDFKIPRPETYKECAMRADADFAAAAELLPNNWDDLQNDPNATFLTFKEETFGNNLLRINKVIVYAMKAKNLLFAACPLMKGSLDTYDYDEELCEMAAEDFARVIKMDRDNVNDLGLANKENHHKLFYTGPGNDRNNWPSTAQYMGGQGEYIFSPPALSWGSQTNSCKNLMPYCTSGAITTPSHRYIHNTFGTANGLSCDEDPTHEFQKEFDNRDPRFYENLILDGDMVIKRASADPKYKYAENYTGGYLRTRNKVWGTGYYVKKWAPITYNQNGTIPGKKGDNKAQAGTVRNHIRLTDVYLLYAEALAATSTYGVDNAPQYGFLPDAPSALEVMNMIRTRWDIPSVELAYQTIGIDIKADRHKFMDVLRRDRAAELCYEGHRWMDLRRWVLAHKDEYKIKSVLNYERDVYTEGDRSTFTNINFSESVVVTRVCEYPKHYWLPFPTAVTQMYEGFPQNPGW